MTHTYSIYEKAANKSYEELYKVFCEHYELDATNTKAVKAFRLAWERGHSYGNAEVVTYFADLVDLIK